MTTGLDPAGRRVAWDLIEAVRARGTTVVLVTHEAKHAAWADRVVLLRSGRIRVDGLVSHRLPLGDFQRGIEIIEQGIENVRKIQILPNS